MAFPKQFGGGAPPDQSGETVAPKKKSKPFGKKGGFQKGGFQKKKGFTPAMRGMSGGGRY
jgi:hypothetical protein